MVHFVLLKGNRQPSGITPRMRGHDWPRLIARSGSSCRHSDASRDPGFGPISWTPTFAGVTTCVATIFLKSILVGARSSPARANGYSVSAVKCSRQHGSPPIAPQSVPLPLTSHCQMAMYIQTSVDLFARCDAKRVERPRVGQTVEQSFQLQAVAPFEDSPETSQDRHSRRGPRGTRDNVKLIKSRQKQQNCSDNTEKKWSTSTS
jgi:hypothetical protein